MDGYETGQVLGSMTFGELLTNSLNLTQLQYGD
jgi:hypothetical protein